jgi:undecaprenyl pyrophosphate synthase
MNEFDHKLNGKLHEYKSRTGLKMYQIAENAGIPKQSLYNFSSSNRCLKSEDIKKLMDLLNLNIELVEKK